MPECSFAWGWRNWHRPRANERINSQSWGSKPYLSTDRRIMYRPSGIQAYLLQDITILTSISVLDMLLRYSYQSQDNDGTSVACEDEHHHIATCHWYPAVVHDIKNGHILQTARCTVINSTDSIASLTYQGQDNGTTVAYEVENHHVATCMPLVSRGRARHKGHILQMTRCTQINTQLIPFPF